MASSVRLVNRFPQIILELEPKTSLALGEGADSIAEAAKARVPVATGALRDAIHVEFEGGGDWAVVAGGGEKNVYYGHMVEFGTRHSPARPYLIPATEARRDYVASLAKTALESL